MEPLFLKRNLFKGNFREMEKKKGKKKQTAMFSFDTGSGFVVCANGPSGKWLPFNTKGLETVGLSADPDGTRSKKGAKRKSISCSLFLPEVVEKKNKTTKKKHPIRQKREQDGFCGKWVSALTNLLRP